MSTWRISSTNIPFHYKKAGSVHEQVHMDIENPVDMISIQKQLYFLTLLEDCSGVTVSHHVLKCYKEFAEQAYKQTGKRISYLRSS